MTTNKFDVLHETTPMASSASGSPRILGMLGGLLAAVSVLLLLILMGSQASAGDDVANYSVLYTFTGKAAGGEPMAGLIRDAAGNLYSTTLGGGDVRACPSDGCGLVFKLDPSRKETVLYTFSGGADGGYPYAGLVQDTTGSLYGTASLGGTYDEGVVFKMGSSGGETVLYNFMRGTDGGNPVAGLVRDSDGSLYGTAIGGGNNSNSCPFATAGCGVVFKLDSSGNETVLYIFTGGADGARPGGSLIRDSVGNLYGTTQFGGYSKGSTCSEYGCGVVFKLSPSGKESVLHAFRATDGISPSAGLVQDGSGNLYGTTFGGDKVGNACLSGTCGVVFSVDSQGQHYKVLYAFTGGADGGNPYAGLIQDATGDLYGTTVAAGNFDGSCSGLGCGVVFKVDRSGKEAVVHAFSGKDGANPYAGLLLHKDSLYGTTSAGGAHGEGVVFKLTP